MNPIKADFALPAINRIFGKAGALVGTQIGPGTNQFCELATEIVVASFAICGVVR
jgi:hypothetical protein